MQSKKDIVKSFLHENNHFFICPICKNNILLEDDNLKCQNNHNFNIAKNGAIYLLDTNKYKPSPIYNKNLFINRRNFILNNFYDEVYEIIKKQIVKNKSLILDLGCGEGTHTKLISNLLNIEHKLIGIDYSKDAIYLATDYNSSNHLFLQADTNNLPLKDNSINYIIDFLSPFNETEIKRVLKKDGILIKILPNSNYLIELRKLYNLSEYEKSSEVLNNIKNKFNILEEFNFVKVFNLDEENVKFLSNMTPIKKENKIEKTIDKITIDLKIMVLRGKNDKVDSK